MTLVKKIKWFWNLMFYNLYLFDAKTSRVYKYLNPFFWVDKISSLNKNYKGNRNNSDINDFKNNLLYNKDVSITWAGIYIGAILAMIECIILNVAFGR